jgi:N-acetyl-anhydromuramyl-L-alanine amidase AmpD
MFLAPLFLGASFLLHGQQPYVPQVPFVPDPRTPMPERWTEPGYGKFWWIQSPNFGKRPKDAVVDTVVVHATVTPTLEATTRWFYDTKSQVSSHFTIGRDGSVVQNVSTFDRAWHAGVSVDAFGHHNVNDYSIGIELVNFDDGKDPYPDAQVQMLGFVIHEMMRRFPIKQIVSHEFIAQPRGRKNDPKGFPWEKLKYLGLPMYYGENPASPPLPTTPAKG